MNDWIPVRTDAHMTEVDTRVTIASYEYRAKAEEILSGVQDELYRTLLNCSHRVAKEALYDLLEKRNGLITELWRAHVRRHREQPASEESASLQDLLFTLSHEVELAEEKYNSYREREFCVDCIQCQIWLRWTDVACKHISLKRVKKTVQDALDAAQGQES